MIRKCVAVVVCALFAGLLVGSAANATPTAPSGCLVNHINPAPASGEYLTYNKQTGKSDTPAWSISLIMRVPTSVDGFPCNAPFLGHSSTCGQYRLVVDRPFSPDNFGPWVRSCWTPQALASGFGGWVHWGDNITIEQMAEAGDPSCLSWCPRAIYYDLYL